MVDRIGHKLDQGSIALYNLSDGLDNRIDDKFPRYKIFHKTFDFGILSRSALSGLSLWLWTRIPFPYYGLGKESLDTISNGNYMLGTVLNGMVNYLSIAFPNKFLW